MEKQGEGEPGRDGLLQQIRPWQEEFRGAIRKTAPCFVPRFRKKPARVTSVPSPVHALCAPSAPMPVQAACVSSVPMPVRAACMSPAPMPVRAIGLSSALMSVRAACVPSAPVPVRTSYVLSAPSSELAPRETSGPREMTEYHSDSASTASADSAPSPPQAPTVLPIGYPQFLAEGRTSDIGLDDGEEIFIDDVLETAEWCVPLVTLGSTPPY